VGLGVGVRRQRLATVGEFTMKPKPPFGKSELKDRVVRNYNNRQFRQ
jgi:hypothetical protein